MPPYHDYSSTLTSSISSYSSPTRSYTSASSVSRYKPPTFSSSTSYKYRSPSTYSPRSSYSVPLSSSTSYVPGTSSLSSTSRYATLPSSSLRKSSITSSSDHLYRSPSLSRRGSNSALTSLDISDSVSKLQLGSSSEKPITTTYRRSTWVPRTSFDSESTVRNGRVGLNNLGNTCFMNAVLQCLCHTQPLVDYCVNDSYSIELNHRSPTRGNLMKAFADFMKKMTKSTDQCSISPYQLRTEVQRYAPFFSGNSQQDAQEFLRYLLQGLHDDINRVKVKPSWKNESCDDMVKTWARYREADDSLIVDLFAGQLKSILKCTECNRDSVTYDPFWDLSLPIPEGYRNSSLRQCFSLFSSPEILEGSNKPFCEACKKKSRSSKKIEINKFPKILVIHLKRFSGSGYGQKLTMMIDSPLTLGNISEFGSQNCTGGGCSYVLYGVVDHDGSNSSGHYIAKCRNPKTKEWNEFNDSRVTRTSNIVTSKSYILFYIQE